MDAQSNWQSELLTLLSSGSPEDFSAALALKERHFPPRLFKFFPPSEYAFHGLDAGTIWLASPYTFNDPFDSGFVLEGTSLTSAAVVQVNPEEFAEVTNLGLTPTDLERLVNGQVDPTLVEKLILVTPEEQKADMRRLIEVMPLLSRHMMGKIASRAEMANQIGLKIASFTEQATSLLLWAHYADSHRGFCVEYCPLDLSQGQPQRRLLFPVIYSSTRFDMEPSFRRFAEKKVKLPNHPIVAAIHKAVDWSYEREWRIVNPDGRDGPGVSVAMSKPRAVYAGVRMSEANRSRLREICDRRSLECVNASLSRERYEVIVDSSGVVPGAA